jgi:pimeloyl-ACP methyl ester carboxylesterase
MLWLFALITLYLVILAIAAYVSTHPPRIPFYFSPASLGGPAEPVSIPGELGDLRGWWMPGPPNAPVLIFAHGYVMNRCELAPNAYFLWRRGYNCLLFDFRAHGTSAGRVCSVGPKEARDVEAAAAWAREHRPGVPLAYIGASMGAAAGTFAQAEGRVQFSALILDSCYNRLPVSMNAWWRLFGGAFSANLLWPVPVVAALWARVWPYRIRVDKTLARLPDTPILFAHGERDRLAPKTEAEANIAAHRGPHHVVWFEGAGHCDGRLREPERYHTEILRFLAQNRLGPGSPPPIDAERPS